MCWARSQGHMVPVSCLSIAVRGVLPKDDRWVDFYMSKKSQWCLNPDAPWCWNIDLHVGHLKGKCKYSSTMVRIWEVSWLSLSD